MKRVYAGIGSRETPPFVLRRMEFLAWALNSAGFTLRSGGAGGADSAFEKGAVDKKEIYLPWQGFNDKDSEYCEVSDEAIALAKKYHPNWSSLKKSGTLFMGRNCYQVLGINLDDPVDFIICYTENGEEKGGTSQAIRIAKDYQVPVFNIWNNDNYLYLLKYILKIIVFPEIFNLKPYTK